MRHPPRLNEHLLIIESYLLRFACVYAEITKQTDKVSRYDWSLLAKKDLSNKYMVIIRNKFDTLLKTSERHTPNNECESIVTSHIKARAEYIPSRIR